MQKRTSEELARTLRGSWVRIERLWLAAQGRDLPHGEDLPGTYETVVNGLIWSADAGAVDVSLASPVNIHGPYFRDQESPLFTEGVVTQNEFGDLRISLIAYQRPRGWFRWFRRAQIVTIFGKLTILDAADLTALTADSAFRPNSGRRERHDDTTQCTPASAGEG